jgi:hypothetical protein
VVSRLCAIATPAQRAILDAWLEFSRLGEQPTHARIAAALGLTANNVRQQWHKLKQRAVREFSTLTETPAA